MPSENIAKAYQLFTDCEYAVVSSLNTDDGYPYGVPVSLVVMGDDLYFHSSQHGRKVSNLAADSRVCVTCVGATRRRSECFNMDYESAVAWGDATLVTEREAKLAVIRLICEKFAGDHLELYGTEEFFQAFERMAIYKVTVKEISSKVRVN